MYKVTGNSNSNTQYTVLKTPYKQKFTKFRMTINYHKKKFDPQLTLKKKHMKNYQELQ